eukprot:scaffold346_cov347-Pavlova_lutheri.AAC.29
MENRTIRAVFFDGCESRCVISIGIRPRQGATKLLLHEQGGPVHEVWRMPCGRAQNVILLFVVIGMSKSQWVIGYKFLTLQKIFVN